LKLWTALRALVHWLWHDPVWGKVIAAGILAGIGLLLTSLRTSPVLSSPLLIPVAAVVGAIAVVLLGWVGFIVYRRRDTKILVLLSSGGTCRDPMAKVILEKLLERRKLKHRLVVRAVGLGPLGGVEASSAARYVIRDMYGEDLLANHKPECLTAELAERADLILAMDRSLLQKTLPKEKTCLLREFFGLEGDVSDPWPNGMDRDAVARYRDCAEELREILGSNLDDLMRVLDL
jgi:protein-tyrosine-phosphatase